MISAFTPTLIALNEFDMQVWAVTYEPSLLTEELYQSGLLVVDAASCAKIKRFYRREDACRGLIAKLLPRMLLKERGIATHAMSFSATETTPNIDSPIAYNISHDNNLVVMAFAPGKENPPAFSIGIDVMKVKIPGRDTYREFIEAFWEQLTPVEQELLFPAVPQDEGLRRFFWMWTLKEAYTKALGIGLGFDFRRVEFNVTSDEVRIDGQIPQGWKFTKFELREEDGHYVGVVAEFLGNTETVVIPESAPKPWLSPLKANSFIQHAIEELKQSM